MRLSKNFTLSELIRSNTATRMNINNYPDKAAMYNLQRLVNLVLQPLRERTKSGIHITSGYRSPVLNKVVRGSRRSAHLTGRAADIYSNHYTPYELAKIIANTVPDAFDQVILEYQRWVHVGISFEDELPRKQELTAYRVNGRTRYRPYLTRYPA